MYIYVKQQRYFYTVYLYLGILKIIITDELITSKQH